MNKFIARLKKGAKPFLGITFYNPVNSNRYVCAKIENLTNYLEQSRNELWWNKKKKKQNSKKIPSYVIFVSQTKKIIL